jgi:predicted neutral ceramidase superfamily lipid hydrolase
MKISKYLGYILKDFFIAFGGLMILVLMYLGIYSIQTTSTSLFSQMILAAAAFTLFRYALINKYELTKKAQMISFFICFTLADIMILIWLFFFSPGKILDLSLLLAYSIIIICVKVGVYAMMYFDGKTQEKQLNDKLREYNNSSD